METPAAPPSEDKVQHVEEERTSADEKGHQTIDRDAIDSLGRISKIREDTETDYVTVKTWVVISMLSFVYGLAWWPISCTIIIQPYIAAEFGEPDSVYWFMSIFAAMNAIGFLVSGPNSDLYGRRIIVLIGLAGLFTGQIICASAKASLQFRAGMAISGFFGGMCFMCVCGVPELLPLKYRHIGVSIADGTGFVTVVVGPIAARMAGIRGGGTWQWLYWANVILSFIAFIIIAWLYKPPKQPKGVSWQEAARGFDWIGLALSSAGLILVLVGIIYTSYIPASDRRVIITLTVGFVLLLVFGFWEAYSNVKFKLCPPPMMTKNNGRDITIPLICESIICMYYYAMGIIYPTMVTTLWTTPETATSTQLVLTTPTNLALVAGVLILVIFGNLFSKWIGFLNALIIMVAIMLASGGVLTLVTPHNETLMIVMSVIQQTSYSYASVAAISLVIWGAHQHDLGIATGLAGVGRALGGAMAQAIYTTILVNTQTKYLATHLPEAAMDAGLSESAAQQLLKVWGAGAEAYESIPGINDEVLAAATLAFKWSYSHGLRIVGLSSLGFGLTGFFLLFLCAPPEPRMTGRIDTFLENDVLAEKNEFH